MLNPYQQLELIKADVFTSMPAKFRNKSRTKWSDPNQQQKEVECSIEGPAFDRQGNLYIVDRNCCARCPLRYYPQSD